uniref:Uncharacterized protein n=1 Tax=Glossina pallidipes TaxID=7398 RepID=A0A1A9ZH78_GLOPL
MNSLRFSCEQQLNRSGDLLTYKQLDFDVNIRLNINSSSGKRYLSNDCVGIYRRYQLCNEQTCPYSNEKFRALQCSYYNGVDFQGQNPSVYFENKIYVFKNALTHRVDDAECELNCKPVGMKYFATLNTTVIDGTMCYHPAEYYRYNYQEGAVCVNGICKWDGKIMRLFLHLLPLEIFIKKFHNIDILNQQHNFTKSVPPSAYLSFVVANARSSREMPTTMTTHLARTNPDL